MNTTRPLCTLCGPTNRSIADSKMVTECAKSVPAPRDADAPAMFARFVACARERMTASWPGIRRFRARATTRRGHTATGASPHPDEACLSGLNGVPAAGGAATTPEPRPYVRHVRQPGDPYRLGVLFLANSAVNNTPSGLRPGRAGCPAGDTPGIRPGFVRRPGCPESGRERRSHGNRAGQARPGQSRRLACRRRRRPVVARGEL